MRNDSSQVTLEELVFASKNRQASDPRDHIYALIGMVKGSRIVLFDPDYSKPTTWVFQKAMMHILESRQDLDFAIFALNQALPYRPSWCVDFSRKDKLENMGAQQLFRRYGTIDLGAATGQGPLELKHNVEHGTLTLKGTCVGKFSSKQTLAIRTDSRSDKVEQVSLLLDQIRPLTHWVRKSWEATFGAERTCSKSKAGDIWRLAANGRLIEELLGAISGAEHPFAALADFEEMDVANFLQKFDPASESTFVIAWDAYLRLVELCQDPLCVFETDTGHVGSGYARSVEGDIVAILNGCKLPLVLRPMDDGSFTLVDAVYVDGIMNGEFFGARADRVEMDFVLR
tara:strand:+ start:49268 stop:50296 length:1029 start_codon:yes stop_codon:yes gene_type:complete